ncbi:MAG TPA: diguanylate cyclase [Thermoleophilia bacterium]|nr:diguanylate cyclase [Thermoleophilia bacterium]
MAQVSSALTSSLVLDDALTTIARRIAEAMDVWGCDIHDYDAQSHTLTVAAWWCPQPTEADLAWIGTVAHLEERSGYDSIISGRETVASYIDDPALADDERAIMQEWNELSTLCTPLVFGDEVIGVLGLVENRAVRRFSEEDGELFRRLAVPAAIAIHNARLYGEQQERNRHIASLVESSRAMSSSFVLEEVLDLVARQAGEALGSDECEIYEFDAEADTLVSRSSFSREPTRERDDIGTVYPLDDHPTDRAIIKEGRVVEETIGDPGLASDTRAFMEERRYQTCLNVPLVFRGEPVGLLVLFETGAERHFTPVELDLAQALGEQAAAAIQNARLYRREETRRRSLVGLLEASRTMTSSLDLREVVERLESEVTGMFSGKVCDVEVRVRSAEGRFLPFRLAMQDEGERDLPAEVPPPHRVVAEALVAGAARQGAGEAAGRLAVPLRVRDEVEGYIEVVDSAARRFVDDEVEVVQILANQAAVALENGRLFETFKLQAITDGLTGLYNHRYFYERLEGEVAKSIRYGPPLSLLMLDLDDFKAFNDRYGHPAGDQVLRDIADILRRQLRRDIDVAARYGGEEFAIILPSTPLAGAQTVGDRLQRQLSALETGDDDGAESIGERLRAHVADARFEGAAGQGAETITVSIGVATFPGSAGDAEGLVRAADKALYLAKRLGKNRVEVFG